LIPDENEEVGNIVLGYDKLDGYLATDTYIGPIIGRYAGRISKGQFILNEKTYQLTQNEGENHLHGGWKGFDKVIWDTETNQTENKISISMTYDSENLEEGYPGNLKTNVKYTLTNNNELIINYKAKTDNPTIVNLTNHSYFNLGNTDNIYDHMLMIKASNYLPIKKDCIPTGEIQSVKGTPMDFRNWTRIGDNIDSDYNQLKLGKGYDHYYLFDKNNENIRVKVFDPTSGRSIELNTSKPGLVFYSGNNLRGNGVWGFPKRKGFCLETQFMPDLPNHNIEKVVLNPNAEYDQSTVLRFNTIKCLM
jgi:aldose 1-epimerase